jgi:hypothetical protein
VTATAVSVFGTFERDTDRLAKQNVRAVVLAGDLGQRVQTVGRLTADHLYVYDGRTRSPRASTASASARAPTPRRSARS